MTGFYFSKFDSHRKCTGFPSTTSISVTAVTLSEAELRNSNASSTEMSMSCRCHTPIAPLCELVSQSEVVVYGDLDILFGA
jgi:hypothetical protein